MHKKCLFEVIQESVEVSFNFEEDAISLADGILDDFIAKEV